MKNITVTVDDDVHRRARIRAAELGTSVSAMVRDFLNGLTAEGSDFERRKRVQTQTLESIRAFRADGRLTRDQVHARDEVR